MQPVFNQRDPEITKKNIIHYMRNVLQRLSKLQISRPKDCALCFQRDIYIDRGFQALETALVFAGYIVAGKPFEYQQIEVIDDESWSSFLRTLKIKRMETYREHIWRLAHEFIDKNTEYEYLPGLEVNKEYAKLTHNCAITIRDGDGKSAGPCCYHLKDRTTCPTHGVVRKIKEG